MSDHPPPRVARRPSFPLVWIVPLVALAVAGWLLLREWRTRGPEITIELADGAGVEAGRTVLQHNGVTVGRVTGVELIDDLRRVAIRLRLERSAAAIAREGSQFWVVQPEISLAGIRGLETLFSGVRLAVRPGHGAPQLRFTGLDRPPPARDVHAGRAFVLEADRLKGLSPGTSVLYREVEVGTVEESRLADDARRVLIRVRIHEPYAALVRPNTRFWSSGGLNLRVGLLGAQLNTGSLASLFNGSISFATPDEDADAEPAGDGTRYPLHDRPEDDWLAWRPSIALQGPQPPAAAPVRPIGVDAGE